MGLVSKSGLVEVRSRVVSCYHDRAAAGAESTAL